MNDSGAAGLGRIEARYLGLGRLFYAARDAVIIGEGESGRIVLWNDAAAKVFGYSEEEAADLLIEDLVPPDLKEQHRVGLARYAQTGKGILIDSHEVIELPALRKDGTQIEVELTLTPIEAERVEGRFVMAIIREITDRKRNEQELSRLNDSLRDFVAMAAHDIRSPLTTIHGLSNVLARPDATLTDEHRRSALKSIERQAQHLGRIVDELLTISQIESRALDVYPLRTEVLPVISRTVEDLERASDVIVQCDPTVTVLVDPDHFQRMVQNYLTNAFRHGAAPVRVKVQAEGQEVVISVCDSGEGVAPELAPRLFDKFARSEASAGLGGTGLGLSIVRGLALANDGDAWHEPANAKGACFKLRLPA